MVAEMLEAWGAPGLERHTRAMQAAYARRAEVILAAAADHLPDVASWRAPEAGMFLWLALGALLRTQIINSSKIGSWL